MKKLLRQALNELSDVYYGEVTTPRKQYAAIEALRAAIAQPESEPVACIKNGFLYMLHEFPTGMPKGATPLYRAPQPAYVPLTEGEIIRMWMAANNAGDTVNVFARAIERAARGEPQPLIWGEFDGKDDLK